jgi:hypothetical protein
MTLSGASTRSFSTLTISRLAIYLVGEYNAFISQQEFSWVACPFFMPTSKLEDGGWLHPSRLPLGGGWTGHCCAPGHEGAEPTNQELRELCNLGYAAGCSRLPKERVYDAVRFSIARDRGAQLQLWFVCESGHRPAGHGMLEYDLSLGQWVSSHSELRIQKMADCFLRSYLLRRVQPASAGCSSSTTP